MRTSYPLATAMHEAGHAAMRLEDADAPPPACMMLHDLGDGETGYTGATPLWRRRPAEDCGSAVTERTIWLDRAARDIRFHLAGPIAELRWRHRSRRAIWLAADDVAGHCHAIDFNDPFIARTDLACVRRRLGWSSPGTERSAFIAAWIETEGRVADLWPRIVALGRLLATKGSLDGSEILRQWNDRLPVRDG